jgi:hypothetical protein
MEPITMKSVNHIKSSKPFLNTDTLAFIEELMDELDLSSARFVFMLTPEWSYGLLTDKGLEYIGSYQLNDTSATLYDPATNQIDYLYNLPPALHFLALLGSEPDQKLLTEFKSCRYSWIGLREDIDRESFYTAENIAALWDKPDEAHPYFIPDRSHALKLAGYNPL